MALSTHDGLCAVVRDSFPVNRISNYLGANDLTTRIVVQASHQVHCDADRGQSSALTRGGLPLALEWNLDLEAEVLSLLHPLDEVLKSTDKFVDEFVLWDIVGRVNSELLCFFLIA